MPEIIKNTILQYIPQKFTKEENLNPARIFEINHNQINKGKIIYLCEREIRIRDNFALNFAIQKSKELNSPLKVVHPKIFYENKFKQNFIDNQIFQTKENFSKAKIDFEIFTGPDLLNYLNEIETSILITDFNPINEKNRFNDAKFKIYEIDGHNIIPARFVSDKQEYNAATIRRKIYCNIFPFLTEFHNFFEYKTEADKILEDFIHNKLDYYAQFKNNPNIKATSDLSKYLNLGFISSQRVALEVIKSNTNDINKENFLEELIIRKELSDNFCLYSKDYKSFTNIPDWAKKSLNSHKKDIRDYIYNLKELEFAKTHDELWNATQRQLINEGKIHGYLRMYWAKKIAEWTQTPETALKIAIYLNDKYAYDSPSPNGYVSILWAIGGLHDRAFRDYKITGKIRRMTFQSLKRKFNINTLLI